MWSCTKAISAVVSAAGLVLTSSDACAQGTLVVLNKAEASASIIDRDSGKEIARVETGAGPHEVAISPDGRMAVVADYGQRSPGSTLSLIDLMTRKRVDTIELGNNTRPHGIVFTPDGKKVVVTTEGSRRLLVVDIEGREMVGSFGTKANVSHMVAISPNASHAFVANIGSGTCTVINLDRGEYVTAVRTGEGAEGVAVHPDATEVWVTNRAADTVSVIETRTFTVTDTLTCGSFPIRVQFTPDGSKALVSCARSGEVAVFDAKTKKQIKRIKMDLKAMDPDGRLFGDQFGDSPVPIGILIPPDGKHAYVANAQADVVAVIDLESLKVVGAIVAGQEPDGMAWSNLELLGLEAPHEGATDAKTEPS